MDRRSSKNCRLSAERSACAQSDIRSLKAYSRFQLLGTVCDHCATLGRCHKMHAASAIQPMRIDNDGDTQSGQRADALHKPPIDLG